MTLLRKNPLICAAYRHWGIFTVFNWMLIRTLCCDVLKTEKSFIVRILSSEEELLVYCVSATNVFEVLLRSLSIIVKWWFLSCAVIEMNVAAYVAKLMQ